METDTLDFLQTAYELFNKFGYISGNSVILNGCVEAGGNVSNGVVFFNGEILPFEGGAVGDFVRVVETTETREFEDGQTKIVYKHRKAVFGSPGVPWVSFHRPKSTYELTVLLQQMTPRMVPVGAIMMWAGAINEIPTGWKLCDGSNGTPDLRSKFVVGYNASETDYNAVGKTGGAKQVALTKNQMPKHNHTAANAGAHNHTYNDSYYIETASTLSGKSKVPGTSTENFGASYVGSGSTDTNNNAILYRQRTTGNAANHTHSISEEGNNEAHENRPPYYSIAFIQFKNS